MLKQTNSQAGPGSEAPGPGRGEDAEARDGGEGGQDADYGANPLEGMSERQKKLFELKQKMVRQLVCVWLVRDMFEQGSLGTVAMIGS